MALSRQATADAYARHLALHRAGHWPALADLFAHDATYHDPFFGRAEGREAIRDFLVRSMSGLEDWVFPIEWTAIDEGRVVYRWRNTLPVRRSDGRPFDFPGISALAYDDDGMVRDQTDLYDRGACLQVLAEAKV
ncbi:MAG: nuclear transport factor 2 family protein, partial [Myxococcota bacterium]